MTDPTNEDRAEWARQAVTTHAEATHSTGEQLGTQIADLLTNLQHLWAADARSREAWDERLRMSTLNYEEEVAEEAQDDSEDEAVAADHSSARRDNTAMKRPRRVRPTPVSPSAPAALTRHTTTELRRVADEYRDLLETCRPEDVDRLIADACVDPLWDDRTNLLSLLANEPEDLALVLATSPDDYAVVRYRAGAWIVDTDSVDWEALEDQAFDPGLDG